MVLGFQMKFLLLVRHHEVAMPCGMPLPRLCSSLRVSPVQLHIVRAERGRNEAILDEGFHYGHYFLEEDE